ncbi:MAG: hypothetical protein J5925_07115 [Clostridia bacterium]|nr:hypothetical protein [Clostridia bacterium]
MKKLLAALLVITLLAACVACGGGNEASKPETEAGSSAAEDSAPEENSKPAEDSKAEESQPEASEPEQSEAESAPEASEPDGSEPEQSQPDESEGTEQSQPDEPTEPPAFIANFISTGTVDTKVNADSANSIRLTGVDVDPTYGAVVLYTYRYGRVYDLEDFAVAVFGYSQEKFGYELTGFSEVGTVDAENIPEDGFLVAAHKTQETIINKLKSVPLDTTVFPHGVQPCRDIGWTAKKDGGKISIDGEISAGEWDDYKIEDVDATNRHWSYAQFEAGNYYSTATFYCAYDDDYIYLCVDVSSPYHYCPVRQDNANGMWQYECIQVKMSSKDPESEYILQHFDHVADNTANKEGVVRAYGFAVNDDGDTCFYENAITKEFTGLCKCTRDDGAQRTVYEVAIPWAEYGITPQSGMTIGLTFSINSTNQDDVTKSVWKNITLRNGGGVIGRNDWSKIPPVTLG